MTMGNGDDGKNQPQAQKVRQAEDECIRDLRRALHAPGYISASRRKCRTPEEIRDRGDLLDPEIGRLRSLMQPGGFRRHFVRESSPYNMVASYSLPQLLQPSLQSRMFESYWMVMDGLFLGDRDAGEDLKFFMENKVTRVINCAAGAIDNYWEPIGVNYLNYFWKDDDSQTILDESNETVGQFSSFIEEALDQGEGVLVQSFRGQSRACCVLAAYLMKKFNWCLQQAIEYLYFRCPVLSVNDGFLSQLESFEERLEETNSQSEDSNSGDAWDGLVLENTFVNCQRAPMPDMKISKKVSSFDDHRINFAEDIVAVKPYDVGSCVEDLATLLPASESKPLQKSALKSRIKKLSINGMNGSLDSTMDSSLDDMKENQDTNGTIIIHRKGGSVSCHPEEIVPNRFGVQLDNKTILLEYFVPRLGLRAHHAIKVDLDGPKVPDNREKSSTRDDLLDDAKLAEKLRQQHMPWLGGVCPDQIAALIGRVRTGKPQNRMINQGDQRTRAPGRSPR